ncbi:MAG: hypothetical protein N2235_21060 [Fischerella sp.]|nr:hypothetical protein [Fischerella sp.]
MMAGTIVSSGHPIAVVGFTRIRGTFAFDTILPISADCIRYFK